MTYKRKEQIGDATLYLGDCLEILPTLGAVESVLTSPPYVAIRDYGGHELCNPIDVINSIELTDGGVCIWNVSDQTINGSESGDSFRQALAGIDRGWRLHDTMIWCKGSGQFPDSNRYWPAFEYIFIFSNGQPAYINLLKDRQNLRAGSVINGTQRQTDGSLKKKENHGLTIVDKNGLRLNYWEIPPEKSNTERTGHPAQMAVRLAKDLIYSFGGPLVVDPFMGSGTTGVACVNLGRKFIGIEIDEKYFDIACERIAAAYAQGRLFA